MYLFLLTLFLPHLVHASGCQDVFTSGATNFRLDERNLSMANARVQDQGQIGTCYANSASLLLRESLIRAGRPAQDISWIHLALVNKTMSYDKPNTMPFSAEGNSILEGGDVCYTINAIKQHGYYCPLTATSPDLVLGSTETSSHFAQLFNRLENYMKAVTNESAERLTIAKRTVLDASSYCLLNRGKQLSMFLNRQIELLNEAGNTALYEQLKKEKKAGWEQIVAHLESSDFYPTNDLLNFVLEKLPVLSTILSQYPSEKEKLLEVLTNENMNRDLSLCFSNFLSQFESLDSQNSLNSCSVVRQGIAILEEIPYLGMPIEEALLHFINNPERSLEFLTEGLYPQCIPPSEFTLPENLACTETPFIVDRTNPNSSLTQNTIKLRNLLKQNVITKKRPMSLSICGELTSDTYLSSTIPAKLYSPIHDFKCSRNRHAVTLIGSKCNSSGNLEYLIQNSYGADCNSSPPHVKCENGKYWLQEKDLVGNLFDASAIN